MPPSYIHTSFELFVSKKKNIVIVDPGSFIYFLYSFPSDYNKDEMTKETYISVLIISIPS